MLRGYRKPCGHLVVSDKFCTFAGRLTEQTVMTIEEVAIELRRLAKQLVAADRKDLLLRAIGVPMLDRQRTGLTADIW